MIGKCSHIIPSTAVRWIPVVRDGRAAGYIVMQQLTPISRRAWYVPHALPAVREARNG